MLLLLRYRDGMRIKKMPHSGVAAQMFQTLADAGINIEMISTSEIKIACVVKQADGPRAVKLLHKAFSLEKVLV